VVPMCKGAYPEVVTSSGPPSQPLFRLIRLSRTKIPSSLLSAPNLGSMIAGSKQCGRAKFQRTKLRMRKVENAYQAQVDGERGIFMPAAHAADLRGKQKSRRRRNVQSDLRKCCSAQNMRLRKFAFDPIVSASTRLPVARALEDPSIACMPSSMSTFSHAFRGRLQKRGQKRLRPRIGNERGMDDKSFRDVLNHPLQQHPMSFTVYDEIAVLVERVSRHEYLCRFRNRDR
jgi:hypothetical protein